MRLCIGQQSTREQACTARSAPCSRDPTQRGLQLLLRAAHLHAQRAQALQQAPRRQAAAAKLLEDSRDLAAQRFQRAVPLRHLRTQADALSASALVGGTNVQARQQAVGRQRPLKKSSTAEAFWLRSASCTAQRRQSATSLRHLRTQADALSFTTAQVWKVRLCSHSSMLPSIRLPLPTAKHGSASSVSSRCATCAHRQSRSSQERIYT